MKLCLSSYRVTTPKDLDDKFKLVEQEIKDRCERLVEELLG